ncbi:MAG: hypothetical protein KJZ54_11505 [Phycisphaerales bacterium]|nr:hypothetical protein [Phycisphaerales bacterium]
MSRKPDTGSPLSEQLRALPFIVAALIAGLTVFAVVVMMVAPGGPLSGTPAPTAPQPSAPPVAGGGAPLGDILLIAVAATLLGGMMGYLVLGVTAASRARRAWQDRSDDEQGREAVGSILLTTTMVRAALVEGPGLFGCVHTMLTGSPAGVVAAAVAIGFLSALLPVRSRYGRLLEHATAGAPTA